MNNVSWWADLTRPEAPRRPAGQLHVSRTTGRFQIWMRPERETVLGGSSTLHATAGLPRPTRREDHTLILSMIPRLKTMGCKRAASKRFGGGPGERGGGARKSAAAARGSAVVALVAGAVAHHEAAAIAAGVFVFLVEESARAGDRNRGNRLARDRCRDNRGWGHGLDRGVGC